MDVATSSTHCTPLRLCINTCLKNIGISDGDSSFALVTRQSRVWLYHLEGMQTLGTSHGVRRVERGRGGVGESERERERASDNDRDRDREGSSLGLRQGDTDKERGREICEDRISLSQTSTGG